jgi:tRNA(fMet)-specific endonuclease VapC
MYILDTDVLTLLEGPRGQAARRLQSRLASLPENQVATTIITYEEQTRGWFALLARAKTITAQISVYRRLNRHLDNYRALLVLDFDDRAAVEFQRLKAMKLRVGTMDLKIASISLANSATLLTRKLADFRVIPNLVVEDWTV